MKAAKKPTPRLAGKPDAIAMLTADHKKVKSIFKQYESLMKKDGPARDKAALVTQVCHELRVHMELEEEIFYPLVRRAIDDQELMDEAEVEHAGARELIGQLEAMEPGDDMYDARVKVLGEQIEHHVAEEEEEMFPEARKADIDMAALGREMAERRTVLMDAPSLPGVPRTDPRSLAGGGKSVPASSAGRPGPR